MSREDDPTCRSPRRSITYACTPPGMAASTRMSTLENALKQQYVPLRTRQPLPLPNHAGESSTENCSELRYAASDADDEASTPELLSATASGRGRAVPIMIRSDLRVSDDPCTARTSFCAALLPDDLITWHRSGGPSS